MDFDLSPELASLQMLMRRFVKEELMPLERAVIARERQGPIGRDRIFPDEDRLRIEDKAKDLGIWMAPVPKEYGGEGLGQLAGCIIYEELAKTIAFSVVTPGGVGIPALMEHTTEELRQNYLMPEVRGDKVSCIAITEANAGSDPAMLEMTAAKDGDEYVLNGTKLYVGAGETADFAFVFARLPGTQRHEGVTCFLVDTQTPGIEAKLMEVMASWCPAEMVFQDCRVPAQNVVGDVGQGFALFTAAITHGRLHIAARCLGIASRCLEMSLSWAKQRVSFGRPIAERQAIQWMLADTAMELEASRWMTYHTAWKADQGRDVSRETSMAKLFATGMVTRAVDRALQIYGGLGYSKELPLERMYRDVRGMRIYEGTDEIHRYIIARSLLRE